jgi:hypothetical protein
MMRYVRKARYGFGLTQDWSYQPAVKIILETAERRSSSER